MAKAKAPTRAAASRAAHARPKTDPERWSRLLIVGGVAAVVLLVVGIVAYGYWSEEVKPLGKTVVRVEDTEVSLGHLERRVQLSIDENSFLLQPGSEQILLALPQTTAQQLEREAKLIVAAEELGVTATDEEIEAQILEEANIADGSDSKTISEAIARAVEESGLRQEEFYWRVEARVLEQKVREHFTANAPAREEQVKARWIVVADEAAANAAIARLEDEDFAAVAKDVSSDTATKDQGGAVDWRLRGTFNDAGPAIEDFLFTAQVGGRSGPLEGVGGFYIVELTDKDLNRRLSDAQKGEFGSRELNEWLDDIPVTHQVKVDLSEEDVRRIYEDVLS